MPATVAYSVCPHDCPSTCALEVERLDAGHIGAVRGAKAHSYTQGAICAKVARYAERVHSPDRLIRPQRRVGPKGSGRFEAISWDDALDAVAEAFLSAADRHGRQAVWPYYYSGTMGLVQRDSINRLRHVMGYSRQALTICSSLINTGWLAGVGARFGPDPREIGDHAGLIVIWGGNPVHTQVTLMHHVAKARKRGARLVVVDPYRTPTAKIADRHVAPKPGTDGALACAMMHVLFRDGLADRPYMAAYADDPAGLEAHVAERTPEWAAAITGVAAEEIVAFAHEYGRADHAIIRIGYGFSRSRNGAVNVHAVSCLPTVTGAWARPGGGAVHSSMGLYPIDRTLIEGTDRLDPATRVLDMSRIGAVLTGDRRDLGDGPPVTAMLIQNCNPMAVAPASGKVREGFARDDLFVCVHEQFMTETAAMADIVLPATSFLEHDDLYVGLGHPHLMIGPRVIDPVGESRCNQDVLCGLASRLGAHHPGFAMTAWQVIDETLKVSNLGTAEKLRERRWVDRQPSFRKAHFLDGFGHEGGRFRFAPDWSAAGPHGAGMPAFPDHYAVVDEADAEHPFRLVTAPSRQFLNTSFTETRSSRRLEGRPTALIHPDDLAVCGIMPGGLVRIGNRQGSVLVHTRPHDGVARGVVVVESVWPNASFIEGRGINELTSDDPGPPAGGAVFHDTAVWLAPVATSGGRRGSGKVSLDADATAESGRADAVR